MSYWQFTPIRETQQSSNNDQDIPPEIPRQQQQWSNSRTNRVSRGKMKRTEKTVTQMTWESSSDNYAIKQTPQKQQTTTRFYNDEFVPQKTSKPVPKKIRLPKEENRKKRNRKKSKYQNRL